MHDEEIYRAADKTSGGTKLIHPVVLSFDVHFQISLGNEHVAGKSANFLSWGRILTVQCLVSQASLGFTLPYWRLTVSMAQMPIAALSVAKQCLGIFICIQVGLANASEGQKVPK